MWHPVVTLQMSTPSLAWACLWAWKILLHCKPKTTSSSSSSSSSIPSLLCSALPSSLSPPHFHRAAGSSSPFAPGKRIDNKAVMGPPTLAMDNKTSPVVVGSSASSDPFKNKLRTSQAEQKVFASITIGEQKPFDFLRILYEGVIAGGAAGVVVETALYPIDTIKTRLQAARGGGKILLKGLYAGLAGNIAGVLPASAIFVGVYEPTKQKLLQMFPENLSAFAHLTAGTIGGAASSIVRVPTEVVKQRMQTGQFASAPDAVRLIVAKEGFKGLYAGYSSFLLRDLPFDALQFCLYEQIRLGYKLAAKRDLNDPENAIIGAFAGALTGALTTPLDVIKTRLMVQGSANQYKGIVDCVQTIVREEGAPALLKGIGPRVLWIGIGGSIFFGVLERTKRLLEERRPVKKNSASFKQNSESFKQD